jgi:hypothetical protein
MKTFILLAITLWGSYTVYQRHEVAELHAAQARYTAWEHCTDGATGDTKAELDNACEAIYQAQ